MSEAFKQYAVMNKTDARRCKIGKMEVKWYGCKDSRRPSWPNCRTFSSLLLASLSSNNPITSSFFNSLFRKTKEANERSVHRSTLSEMRPKFGDVKRELKKEMVGVQGFTSAITATALWANLRFVQKYHPGIFVEPKLTFGSRGSSSNYTELFSPLKSLFRMADKVSEGSVRIVRCTERI